MVASDIQKVITSVFYARILFDLYVFAQVEAVEHELLADYVNVVVFSIKGSRSLASFLSGGGSSSPFSPPSLIKLTAW